ncbi:uncharacterized protein LOC121999607 [Zingiber officinale]|uniref:uncharacterized protein LOC121999607 n=1 Tax=Zingiber officinale TaxID=94328 RepID=UPI001C4CCA8B|nr:uncharacterized protein LOC121999607 [Zingiber officinale]
MSFGLKNADIEETFETLRTYGVKLNPQKCLFGAKNGCFLGYIVTERGIEANPSKIHLKTADRSLPFFKILRRATKFQWDAECDKAFEELKVYLNSLPVLAKPIAGEALRVYLSLTEYDVGSALVRPDGEEQLVYFLSHILKDVESRYTGLEKLAFALVLATQRLCPYFLAHPIVVMTNNPLGRVLLNPEASGQLIKWTTELSEFNIRYQPRTTIKAQSLVDFVTEVQEPEPKAAWQVYVDGSSNRQGSGIEVLLISPHGERIHLSERLDYRAINNEAEYEALIAGLQAARHVGAGKVLIHSDLQLATQQLSGAFEISSVRLKLYVEAFEKLKASFREVLIQKIPRVENHVADELAKLASSISLLVIQQLIEQVSLVAHIDRMEGLTFPNDWRTAITEFLKSGATSSDRLEAYLLRRRAGRFILIGDQLYKKAFSRPLLKCIRPEDVDYILQEVDELPGVLWVLQTMSKEGTGMTSFHLVYGGEAIIPVEVKIESDWTEHYDESNAERRCLKLDLVDETRAKAAVRLMAYRQRMKQNYNRRVIPRSFQVGDLVWKKVKPVGDVTKLGAPWAGPFKIVEKLRSGAYYLEDEDGQKLE